MAASVKNKELRDVNKSNLPIALDSTLEEHRSRGIIFALAIAIAVLAAAYFSVKP